jgi:uncharacterized membrane protein YfcA
MEIVIGLAIGILLGLTGAGGSLFAVPLIIYFLNFSVSEAMGIALGAVCVSAASGIFKQIKTILWVPGLILAMAGMLTAPVGKWLAEKISDMSLMIGFSLLTLFIAVNMWLKATRHPEQSHIVRATLLFSNQNEPIFLCRFNAKGQFQLSSTCVLSLIVGGLVVGLLSGLFGVGGGFLIVPFLCFLGRCSMIVAIATSLLIITLISGSGFIGYLFVTETIQFDVLIKIIVAGIVGMFVSQKLSPLIANDYLEKLFAVLLLVLSVFNVLQFV